jgi:hypothetical protein
VVTVTRHLILWSEYFLLTSACWMFMLCQLRDDRTWSVTFLLFESLPICNFKSIKKTFFAHCKGKYPFEIRASEMLYSMCSLTHDWSRIEAKFSVGLWNWENSLPVIVWVCNIVIILSRLINYLLLWYSTFTILNDSFYLVTSLIPYMYGIYVIMYVYICICGYMCIFSCFLVDGG